ncbi:hypothetical protein N2152v2_006982 [Parachlorella kessleri]
MGPRKRPAQVQAVLEDDGLDAEASQRARQYGAKRTRSAGGRVSSFFQAPASGSGKTLADLALGGGDESLLEIAAQLPSRHTDEKGQLRDKLQNNFGLWYLQWRAGSSLLFYGFGSKRDLLDKFVRSETEDGACLAVNGLMPGLTPKQILVWAAALVKQVKPQSYRSLSKQTLLDMIAGESPQKRIYVVIHNIDGPGLRDPAAQRMLSELAALPNVHLAASFDHVDTPLLWDMQTNDRFSWVWHNATTFEPYFAEVRSARLPLLLAGKSESSSKESASVVLSTLSHNAREVFRLIADQQLEVAGEAGVSMAKLFQMCRERFLVSNEMLLKSFLVEFKDHELLTTKKAQDGSELLCIPLEEAQLRGVLEDLDHMA